MILITEPAQGWGMVHEVIRLHGNGESAPIATFENILDAERLIESLDWEWPGEYVIHHLAVNLLSDSSGGKLERGRVSVHH